MFFLAFAVLTTLFVLKDGHGQAPRRQTGTWLPFLWILGALMHPTDDGIAAETAI